MTLRASLLLVNVSIILGAPWLSGCSVRAKADLTRRVEQIASELPWLTTGDVLSDRDRSFGPKAEQVTELLRELRGLHTQPAYNKPSKKRLVSSWTSQIDPDELRTLLRHTSAKVRTLAIALLFQQERLDVMPDIAALVDDFAETFPSPEPLSNPVDPWPMDRKSVSDYALAAVNQYVNASAPLRDLRQGNALPKDGKALAELFSEMSRHRDPFTSTATLSVAMNRATGGNIPIPGDRVGRAEYVLTRADELPMPRRFFVLLTLGEEKNGLHRYPSSYLVDLARQVPRELRIGVLNGQRPCDDPDLPKGFGWHYFLKHPVDLLQVDDIALLMQLEAKQLADLSDTGGQAYAASQYVIAVARLDPSRAEEVLIPAMQVRQGHERSSDQASAIAAALAELGGDRGVHAAVNQFFDYKPRSNSHGGGRERLLSDLFAASPSRYRQFVARVIRDDRLFKLGPPSTRRLVRAVQGYSGLLLVDEKEYQDSFGIDENQSREQPPYLPEWHERLRESVDQWDKRP